MIQKTEAVVLKREEFRETSLILTFFTRDFGKIKGLAKGVRVSQSKWGSNFSTCSYNLILFYPRKTLSLITEAELVKDFVEDFSSMEKNILANYFLELLDSVMPLEDKNEKVFNFLIKILSALIKEVDILKLLYIFEIKILQLIGFSPQVNLCVYCKKHIIKDSFFTYRWGGLLCRTCTSQDKETFPVRRGTLSTINYILKAPEGLILSSLRMDRLIKNEIGLILNNFLPYHLENLPRSYELVEKYLYPDSKSLAYSKIF